MFFTTGDVFWSLATAGLTLFFAGVGLLVGERADWPLRVAGGAAMAAGLVAIAVPAVFGLAALA
jgi:hypothetical protein